MLALVSCLVAANAWLATSLIEPRPDGDQLLYVLVLRPVWQLAAWGVASLAAFGGLQRWFATRRIEWPLEPFLLLLFPLASVLLLATPAQPLAGPWLHLFVDLRWPLVAGVAVLDGLAIDEANGHRWTRGLRARFDRFSAGPSGSGWLELGLILVLASASLLSSPRNRFQSSLIGDEPKYLRFLENWYRGQGLDISVFPDIKDLPLDAPPRLGLNVRRFVSATAQVARDLTVDVPHWLGLRPTGTPGGARSGGGWFIGGKHGGVYQVHNPGMSLLLLPAYIVDRYFLNWTSDVHPQFPTNLYLTNASLLVLHLLWALALFRLLLAHTGCAGLSWILAAAAMASLPAAAFSYQYYPEAAAGLALTLLVLYATRPALESTGRAIVYGLLAGCLPWLHMRFGPAAVIFGATIWLHRSRPRRVAVAFSIGLLAPLAVLGLYDYYLSGSPMPWSLYAIIPDSPGFSLRRGVVDLPRFWFDSHRGLLALAPVYLLAAAGVRSAWQRHRWRAALVTTLIGSLALLSAAHAWGGGDSTPLRLIAAAIPLLMLFIADLLSDGRCSRWMRALFVVLVVLSVWNGLIYNGNLVRTSQYMLLSSPSVSGWNTPLLLPATEALDARAGALLLAWIVVTMAAAAWPRSRGVGGSPRWTTAIAAVTAVIATAGSLIGLAGGARFDRHFARDGDMVSDDLLFAALNGHVGTTVLAGPMLTRRVRLTALYPNYTGAGLSVRAPGLHAAVGEPAVIRIDAFEPERGPVWGLLSVDFGDGSPRVRIPMVGRAAVPHTFGRAGDVPVSIDLTGPGGLHLTRTEVAHIVGPAPAPAIDLARPIAGLPADLVGRAADICVDAITIGPSTLDVRATIASGSSSDEASTAWIWLIGRQQGGAKATLIAPMIVPGVNPRRLQLAATLVSPPDADSLVDLVVGMRPGVRGALIRSAPVTIRWPAPNLTAGAPVTLAPSDAWQ